MKFPVLRLNVNVLRHSSETEASHQLCVSTEWSSDIS